MSRSLPPDFALLQVTPRLDAGGVEQTTLDVSAAVAQTGGVSLVASQGGRMEGELIRSGGALIRFSADSKNPLQMIGNAGRLGAVIRRRNVAVVHARSRAPAYSALWAAQATRTPFVTTYHGIYNAGFPLKRAYNSVMARGDLVIANSAYTRDHVLAEHGVDPDRVVVIPRGVDLSRFDPSVVSSDRVKAVRDAWNLAVDDRRPVVLLAGRLTRWKGQLLLIQAAAKLRTERPELDFVIVLAGDEQGRREYRAMLDQAIADAGLGDRVRVVGHCVDMAAAYLACDLAVAPSLEPEAFGRTAVEPQAMGRAVLAADHGAACETVLDGETGWRVAPGDIDAWAAALGDALAVPATRRRAIGVAGRARVRRLYSLEAMTSATLDVYARVLEMHASKPGYAKRSGA